MYVTVQAGNGKTFVRPRSKRITLAVKTTGGKLPRMCEPIDIDLIKGRQRAEDMRRMAAGEVTPEELDRENSFIRSRADIVWVDLSPKGTPESWARIIERLERNEDSI